MKSIYKKHLTTVALVWAGCFVLFLFAYMLVLGPQKKNKKEINKEVSKKKQMYNFALKATRAETKLKLNEQIERLQSSLREFVINSEDSANLVFDISQIASDKEVGSFSIGAKDNLRNSEIPNCKHIFENRIGISFTAGFNQFATLLNALERHRPVVFVDNFSITRSDKDDSGHQVNMDLAVFVRKRQDS